MAGIQVLLTQVTFSRIYFDWGLKVRRKFILAGRHSGALRIRTRKTRGNRVCVPGFRLAGLAALANHIPMLNVFQIRANEILAFFCDASAFSGRGGTVPPKSKSGPFPTRQLNEALNVAQHEDGVGYGYGETAGL